MTDNICGVIAAIAGLVPTSRRNDLGISLYYRQDADNKVDLTWREGEWLWTLRDKAERLKGWGHAQTGAAAMRMALVAGGFAKALSEKAEATAPTVGGT
jgi:hypothetical protein